jgi:hypothetical protein
MATDELPLPGQELNDDPRCRRPWSAVLNTALAGLVMGSSHGFVHTWTRLSSTCKLSPVVAPTTTP